MESISRRMLASCLAHGGANILPGCKWPRMDNQQRQKKSYPAQRIEALENGIGPSEMSIRMALLPCLRRV